MQGDSASTRSALLVVNPVARGMTPALCANVALELERLVDDVSVHCPSARAEAGPAVERAVAAAVERDRPLSVVCMGGDGTVREVAEAMARGLGSWPNGHARAAARLSVIPAGSGNSAYRALWGPREWTRLLPSSIMGPRRRVGSLDLLRIRETDRATVLGLNAGLGARVAANLQAAPDVDDERRAQIIGASVARASPFPGRLEVDGATLHEGQITHVTIGGVRSFMGGLLQMLPDARVDDGLLDVCLITEVDTRTLAEVVSLMRTGEHIHHPSVRYARGMNAVLERTDGADLELEHDGDVAPGSPRIALDVVPAAVPIATDQSEGAR